ncbi:D-Ala-D-Ala carboxypeptidase family metallohydrolase [Telluribacter humicola]|uniref:D-Ala-D-Ala carboxypeptidase family metallohydrolase n=1 Tax=Telluribacter humicola TaxID=1720261 RepID=UPI001A970459|nr:D-Ala-D-Ala carboxypeptidase family metallohydrolase [Telluribacter humicola]
MNLTTHFRLSEFLFSQEATRKGIAEQFEPSPQIVQNLNALCVNILEPLRINLNVPIRITSGYRCARLNRAIGGAAKSQHLVGEAADIEADGVTNKEVLDRIIALQLPYDQLISEFPDEQGNPKWVHVSFSARNRRQVLVAYRDAGKVRYRPI